MLRLWTNWSDFINNPWFGLSSWLANLAGRLIVADRICVGFIDYHWFQLLQVPGDVEIDDVILRIHHFIIPSLTNPQFAIPLKVEGY